MPNAYWAGVNRRAALPPDWDDRRAAVLARDGYRCRIAGPQCYGIATEAHHVGDNTNHGLTNLQAACQRCHILESAAQGGRAAQSRRPKRQRPPEPHPGLVG